MHKGVNVIIYNSIINIDVVLNAMKHDKAGPEREGGKEIKSGSTNHCQHNASVFHWISRRAGEKQ